MSIWPPEEYFARFTFCRSATLKNRDWTATDGPGKNRGLVIEESFSCGESFIKAEDGVCGAEGSGFTDPVSRLFF